MTPEQMARFLNARPSGQSGTWRVEPDGSGVFYTHGRR